MDRESRRVGLKWKIAGIYAGVMLILASLVIVGISQVTKNTLREQLDRHALAIATNLTDAAAGYIVGKNLLALKALGSFPAEFRQGLPIAGQRQVHRRELSLNGRTVREIGLPVLGGQFGSVYV